MSAPEQFNFSVVLGGGATGVMTTVSVAGHTQMGGTMNRALTRGNTTIQTSAVIAPDDDTQRLVNPDAQRVEAVVHKLLQLRPHLRSEDVVRDREVGRGASGIVVIARHRDCPVAMKMQLSGQMTLAGIVELSREATLLSQLSNPHVISWQGICVLPDNAGVAVVTEFMQHGDLERYILSTDYAAVSREARWELAAGVAAGLSYLHSRGVVHCDVKPANVLVGSGGRAVLADMGGAYTEGCGWRSWAYTHTFAAPEVLSGDGNTAASDVFSMGCVLYCIIGARVKPFPQSRNNNFQALPTGWEAAVGNDPFALEVIGACWNPVPHLRPTADSVHTMIRRMLASPPVDETLARALLAVDAPPLSGAAVDAIFRALPEDLGDYEEPLLRSVMRSGSQAARTALVAAGRTELCGITLANPPGGDAVANVRRFQASALHNLRHATALHLAAAEGDVGAAAWLLDAGADLEAVNGDDETPLRVALTRGHVRMSELLRERGALSGEAGTALFALNEACDAGNVDIVGLLLSWKVPADVINHYGWRPLMIAVYRGETRIIEMLLAAGVDGSAADVAGGTPLHVAAEAGHANVVRLLLERGAAAHIEAQRRDGATALYLATQAGHFETVDALLQAGADPLCDTPRGGSALHSACRAGHARVVDALLKACRTGRYEVTNLGSVVASACSSGSCHVVRAVVAALGTDCLNLPAREEDCMTALHIAADSAAHEMLMTLLALGADPMRRCGDGRLPLHIVSSRGDVPCVRALLEAMNLAPRGPTPSGGSGAVDTFDEGEETPLFAACLAGQAAAARVLLEHGADPNRPRKDGRTALVVSCANEETVAALVEAGADVNLTSASDGMAPLHMACCEGNVHAVRYLLAHGADANLSRPHSQTPLAVSFLVPSAEVVRALLDAGADVNVDHGSPLRSACEAEDPEIARLLLDAGAAIDAADPLELLTALHVACTNGRMETIALLLQRGADINVKSNTAHTPLHAAAAEKSVDVLRFLLESGAKLEAVTHKGETPLHVACANSPLNVVTCLVERGAQLNRRTKVGATPLVVACLRGDRARTVAAAQEAAAVVDLLLRHGADQDRPTYAGATPLFLAAIRGNLALVEKLLDHRPSLKTIEAAFAAARLAGRDKVVMLMEGQMKPGSVPAFLANNVCTFGVTGANVVDQNGWRCEKRHVIYCRACRACAGGSTVTAVTNTDFFCTCRGNPECRARAPYSLVQPEPLVLACAAGNVEEAERLINDNADIEAVGGADLTPLRAACTNGHGAIVERLLVAGVDVENVGAHGESPLMLAAGGGFLDIVVLLVGAGANVLHTTTRWDSALTVACERGYLSIVTYLSHHGASLRQQYNLPPLHRACAGGHVDVVTYMLDCGVPVNEANNEQLIPLWVAAQKGRTEVVELLLARGATVDAINADGATPLHTAANFGMAPVMRQLVAAGAPLNHMAENGTPLHSACETNQVEAVAYLLEAGALKDVVNKAGDVPLGVACRRGALQCVELLLAAGVAVDQPIVAAAEGLTGATALLLAIYDVREPVARLLLAHGANVNAAAPSGMTPLIQSLLRPCSDALCLDLLRGGAHVNVATASGITPLHAACSFPRGRLPVVEALVDAGADLYRTYGTCATPLFCAATSGYIEIVRFLLARFPLRPHKDVQISHDAALVVRAYRSPLDWGERRRSDFIANLDAVIQVLRAPSAALLSPTASSKPKERAVCTFCFTGPTPILQNGVTCCGRNVCETCHATCHSGHTSRPRDPLRATPFACECIELGTCRAQPGVKPGPSASPGK